MSATMGSRILEDANRLAPRVYQLAQLVCRELEILRESHGEATYQSLLPVSLRILEEMNQVYAEKTKLDLDLNLQVAEKNDILFQLERANKLRLAADQRVHYLEDELIALKKDSQLKIEKLESLLRHREMLTRNAEEHAQRLEERDAQLQTELNAAQDRYNELLRTHIDLLERNKLANSDCGSQRTTVLDQLDATKSNNYQVSPLDGTKVNDSKIFDPRCPTDDNYLATEPPVLLAPMRSADRVTSFINLLDESMDCESVVAPSTAADGDDDDEAVRISEAADCTENCYGMMKEVEKLINENMELSATKNALNVVKNDLIRKLDDVTGEKLLLAKELESVRLSRDQTRSEANRLVRQMHSCQNKISHLVARLKLYEDVDESILSGLRGSSSHLAHATSCTVLNTDSAPSLVVPGAPVTNMGIMSSKLGGSTNSVAVKENHRVAASMIDLTVGSPVLVTEGGSGITNLPSNTDNLDEAMRSAKLGEPCFTKREMARVIAERNHYKENLIELQEALRHMESLRAERLDDEGRSHSRLQTYLNSPVNLEANRRTSLAHQILSAIQTAADDFANGVSDFFSEIEPLFVPSVPSEAQQHNVGFSGRPSTQPSSPSRQLAQSSELRRMFSHLIGHAAGHSTEAFLGTGNDFAATVNCQSLTSTTQRLLDRRYASQLSITSCCPPLVSQSPQHLRNRTLPNIVPSSLPEGPPNVCTRPMASVCLTSVGVGHARDPGSHSNASPTTQNGLPQDNSHAG